MARFLKNHADQRYPNSADMPSRIEPHVTSTGLSIFRFLPLLFLPIYYAKLSPKIQYSSRKYPVHGVEGNSSDAGAQTELSELERAHVSETCPVLGHPTAYLSLEQICLPPTISGDEEGIKSTWHKYITARCSEWKFFGAAAATLLLTLLQMLSNENNLIVRSFILLAILRAAGAICYTSILLYFFRQRRLQTHNFIVSWYKFTLVMKVAEGRQRLLSTPWTIIALPAVALSWSIIFLTLAILCFLWGTEDRHDRKLPSPWPSLVIMMRIFATSASIGDVFCIIWVIGELKEIRCKHESVGETN